jgi:hypothetical protein
MPTNRTRIPRGRKPRISARAVELFEQMQLLCSYEDWCRLNGELHAELGLPPWEDTYQDPDNIHWTCRADLPAQARFRALKEAAGG